MSLLITITGPCQSSKTTLAHRIAKLLRENDIPREVKVVDPRHAQDDETSEPMFPARLRTRVDIHVGETFPPKSLNDAPSFSEKIEQAIALWDEGYTRLDSDKPGWLRWHSIHEQESHMPLEAPMEVWFFIRGAFFGIGDHIKQRDRPRERD